MAITATATKEVQLDIVQMLELSDYRTHLYSIDRPNIATVIKKCSSSLEEKTEELISLVKNLIGPGIIYASTRKWTEDLAKILVSKGIKNVSYYHGGND
ncbi:hypothetical protein KHA80_01640 [Anaerobacillus sp. HL2]|nr:hypothetical protein KHA80_01640 [Anaerobacillus sp. HL2]